MDSPVYGELSIGFMSGTVLSSASRAGFADCLGEKNHVPSKSPKGIPMTAPTQNIAISFSNHGLPDRTIRSADNGCASSHPGGSLRTGVKRLKAHWIPSPPAQPRRKDGTGHIAQLFMTLCINTIKCFAANYFSLSFIVGLLLASQRSGVCFLWAIKQRAAKTKPSKQPKKSPTRNSTDLPHKEMDGTFSSKLYPKK